MLRALSNAGNSVFQCRNNGIFTYVHAEEMITVPTQLSESVRTLTPYFASKAWKSDCQSARPSE